MTHDCARAAIAKAIELAKEDPMVVKEYINRLRESGEIGSEDLRNLEGIADRWIAIAKENLEKGQRR